MEESRRDFDETGEEGQGESVDDISSSIVERHQGIDCSWTNGGLLDRPENGKEKSGHQ